MGLKMSHIMNYIIFTSTEQGLNIMKLQNYSIKFLLLGAFIEEAKNEMTLNLIPHGKFTMQRGDHKIDVELTEDFYLASTPVTQAQWSNVMNGYIPEDVLPVYKTFHDYFPCENSRGLDKPVWNLSGKKHKWL